MAKVGRPKRQPQPLPFEEAQYDLKEVGKILGISPHTVRKRAKAGDIGYILPAGIMRFRKSDIQAYLDSIDHLPGSTGVSAKARKKYGI